MQAGDNSIPCTSNKTGSKSVPGWMEFVHEARSKSLFWHNIWIDCGRPRTRAAYHYAIRFVRKNEEQIVKQRFADTILANHNRDFWSEVHRMKFTRKSVSTVVDGY